MHFLIKSAFLAFYLRLSPNRTFRLWVGVGFGLVYGSLLIGILILVFQCVPVASALKLADRLKSQCMNREFILYAPAATVSTPFHCRQFVIDFIRTSSLISMSLSCPSRRLRACKCLVGKSGVSSPSFFSALRPFSWASSVSTPSRGS